MLPVDPSGRGLRGVELVCCRKADFIGAIRHCHDHARELQEHMRSLLDQTAGQRRHVLLTETYAEAGHVRPERDVPMYCEIVRAHCEPGSTVIIKPHPLEAPGKGARIQAALGGDYKVVNVAPRFGRYPIEIWLELLQGCGVICTAYPVLSLKYAHDIDVVQPMNEAFIARWIEPAFQRWARDSLDLYTKPLERLRGWNGREILWSGGP